MNEKNLLIGEEEIHRIQVRALVDTGAVMLCLIEHIREIVHLDTLENAGYN